ncbi:unnamed protein product [Amoebophrya sp. A25]|nr:unnamed protein product [Amoebophrya sp. A25]|eukprot:GSA25T00023428001.1
MPPKSSSGGLFSSAPRYAFSGKTLRGVIGELLPCASTKSCAETSNTNTDMIFDGKAQLLCQLLLDAGVIYPHPSENKDRSSPLVIAFDPKRNYRLRAHSGFTREPAEYTLNVWKLAGAVDDGGGKETEAVVDAVVDMAEGLVLLKRANRVFDRVQKEHINSDSGLVDYLAIGLDPDFDLFRAAVAQLQRVALHNDFYKNEDAKIASEVATRLATRKAFLINCYNLLVKHAFVEMGIPGEDLSRLHFFSAAKYLFANGVRLSLHEMENGLLRHNRSGVIQLLPPLTPKRFRQLVPLDDSIDNRLHFALNCGAKSCPPVKWFSAEAVDEELRIVAGAFCEDSGNVLCVEEASGSSSRRIQFHASKIFDWYRPDFKDRNLSPYHRALADALSEHCRGQKKALLEGIADGKRTDVDFRFLHYDWSTNSTGAHKEFVARSYFFSDLWR